MFPYMLKHTGKSLTLYKDLLPGKEKKKNLFACTNGHIVTNDLLHQVQTSYKRKRKMTFFGQWQINFTSIMPLRGEQLDELWLLSASLSLVVAHRARLEAKCIVFKDCTTTQFGFSGFLNATVCNTPRINTKEISIFGRKQKIWNEIHHIIYPV